MTAAAALRCGRIVAGFALAGAGHRRVRPIGFRGRMILTDL